VDVSFLNRAGRRPVVSLETLSSQLSLFADLRLDLQEMMLADTLAHSAEAAHAVDAILAAWRHGDDQALAALLGSELKSRPELRPIYERVFLARNREMARQLALLLEEPGVVFAVVGAGHLVGEESIPTLLADRGYPAIRIWPDASSKQSSPIGRAQGDRRGAEAGVETQ
jgi:uncharacterized protein YbaP (TraB family)